MLRALQHSKAAASLSHQICSHLQGILHWREGLPEIYHLSHALKAYALCIAVQYDKPSGPLNESQSGPVSGTHHC